MAIRAAPLASPTLTSTPYRVVPPRANTDRVAETPAEYVVYRPKLYLDTSIPSALTARPSKDTEKEKRRNITRGWWDLFRWQFNVHYSETVEKEAQEGDRIAAQKRIDTLKRFTRLELDDRSKSLSTKLISGGFPVQAKNDAEHIAISARYELKFLLTWNYRHLANPQLQQLLMDICHREGYNCPTILTPEQILQEKTHERSSK